MGSTSRLRSFVLQRLFQPGAGQSNQQRRRRSRQRAHWVPATRAGQRGTTSRGALK